MASWIKYGKDRHRLPGKWVQATDLEEVWGVHYRKDNARAFCSAVKVAEKSGREYGVALAPQPDNPKDPNAIAVVGQCMVKPWFRAQRLREWHIGYVRRDLAAELQDEFLRKNIPVASELYQVFEQGDFLEFKFFVLAPPGHSIGRRQAMKMGAPAIGTTDEQKEVALLAWIENTENEDAKQECGVAPRPYLDLAKLYRRRKMYDMEVALLERYASQRKAPGALPGELAARLVESRELRAKVDSRA